MVLTSWARSILPGVFYWKISSPESDNRHLLKTHDEENDEEAGPTPGGMWNQMLLRRSALALACYGVFVMVTCLTLNIFYHT